MNAPQTEGSWRYAAESGETLALFATPEGTTRFILRCDRTTRQVGLGRAASAQGPVPMRVLTETSERVLNAQPVAGSAPLVAANVGATDPILDAMAFSKGRFGIEMAGVASLYLPAQPVVSRVIEDCR
jgi:hypothetical protein